VSSSRNLDELGRLARRNRSSLKWIWFIVPAGLTIIIFYLIPAVLTLGLSFTNISSATGLRNWKWIGLGNYRKIVLDPDVLKTVWLTLKYIAGTITLSVTLALVISLITTHIPQRVGVFFRMIWLLPRITPAVIFVMIVKILAADAPYGVLNQVLFVPLGLPTANWIPKVPFLSIILMSCTIGMSFGMIIFTSAIESISKDIMTAALVDGASALQRIRYVILPQLRWPILFTTTYQTLSLLTSYEYIFLLTDGNFGTEVWSLWQYHTALNNYYGNFLYGFGAALAAVLLVVGIIWSVVYMRFFNFNELMIEPKIEQG
jgi:inositol-phosphate transport system permease protein